MGRFRSTILLHILTATSLLIALASIRLVSNYFGTTQEKDAYDLAARICFILILFADPLKEAAIARLKMIDLADRRAANRSISAVINLFALIAAALMGLAYLALGPISSVFASVEAPGLESDIFRIAPYLLPLCLLQPLVILLEGYLHVQRRFLVSQVSRIVGLLVALVVLALGQAAWGILAYVAYRLVVSGVQLLGCIAALPGAGFRYSPTLRLPQGRQIVAKFAPLFGGDLALVAVLFMSQWFLRSRTGAVAAFGYAELVFGAVLMIIVTPISSVIWPDLITAFRDGRRNLWDALHTPLRFLLTVLTGAGTALLCLAGPAVMILLENGRFNQESRELTARCLKILAVALPFWGLMVIATRGMVVQGRTLAVLRIKIALSGMTIGAIFLVAGHRGAPAFAPVYLFVAGVVATSLFLVRSLFHGGGRTHHANYVLYLGRILLAAAVVSGAAHLLQLEAWLIQTVDTHGKVAGLATIAGLAAFLIAAYAAVLYLTGERTTVRYALAKARGLLARRQKD